MALAPRARIGHYEVVQLLGAGGMGEVYRARDTRLGRDVALKILPEAFAGNPNRLARFEREATTLAALNHPHIAHVYGIEESGPTHAIVMELVDGEDLTLRIARGALPLAEALQIARQIAEALDSAHGAGIVHRDLKPANVKLRSDGTVKVLDFGLAKGSEPISAETGARTSTLTSPAMSQAGVILGTAAYMSPEQATGRAVDRRADIWAFGCVLFEMLSGRRCFLGETTTETLAAILEREPDWTALPSTIPESIRRLLSHCLQKDPKRRLHHIADARIEIEDAIAAPATPTESGPRRHIGATAAALLAIVGVAALAAAAYLRFSTSPASAPIDLRVDRLTDRAGLEETPSLSPDGKWVAYTASAGGTRQVHVQLLAGGAPLRITRDAVNHEFPRWTPDSSALVYFSPAAPGDTQGTLWEISALGGQAARRITSSVGSADVSAVDGRLAFFRLADQKIQLVAGLRDGSGATVVAEFPPARYYLYPRWSPDGKWIAFQSGDSIRFDVFVAPAAGGEPKRLTNENLMMNGLAWLPDSSGIVYSSSRNNTMPYLPTTNLWSVRLDNGRVRQVTMGETSYLHPDVSASGVIVAARMRLQSDIWRFPSDGRPADNVAHSVRVTRQTGHVLTPTVGASDAEVAFLSDSGGHANLWVITTATGELRQITHERDPNVAIGVPVWSPDGSAIAFVYTRGNPGLTFGVWLVRPDGSNLRSVANPGLGPAWSHDGRWIYYATRGDLAASDVVLKKIAADGGPAVTVTGERLRNVIGSDGATLWYVVERPLVDGRPEFEIRAATPEDGPFRVVARISPTRVPIWQIVNPTLSPDGKWLAQALTDGYTTNIWALSTATGEWRQITDFADRATFIARRVSWSADGRFVLAAIAEGDADIVRLEGLLTRPGR